MTVDDDLDALYSVSPDQFTATRKDLVAAAKERGDADGAKRIAASRRPTVAAWVVNVLVRTDDTARARLGELTERLRAAHAAMDGARIRESSTAQRKLVDQLVRTAFAAADVSQPSAALRDDVVGTLQAAVADPDVAARLGRLERAERWSGFGDFGTVTAVGAPPKAAPKKSTPTTPGGGDAELAAARATVETARADVEARQRTRDTAIELLSERRAAQSSAQARYEKLLESLSAAEHDVEVADADHADAETAARSADDAVTAAKAVLAEAESDVQRLAASTDSSS